MICHQNQIFSFSLNQTESNSRRIWAIEYDAGTENPQYFGRDKVKKYEDAYDKGHPIFTNNDFQIITFADNRKRIVQLIRHSIKFFNKRMNYLFASIEDLEEQGNIFTNIYIDPQKFNAEGKMTSSIIT